MSGDKPTDLSLHYHDREPIGRIISKMTSDVSALNEILTQGFVTTIQDAFTFNVTVRDEPAARPQGPGK